MIELSQHGESSEAAVVRAALNEPALHVILMWATGLTLDEVAGAIEEITC